MEYSVGFRALEECLAASNTNLLPDLATLKTRFEENQRADRLFGSSENTRNGHAQIIFALNDLALKHCGVSFNDLCSGAKPKPNMQPHTLPEKKERSSSPRRERALVPFKIQVVAQRNRRFQMRAFETPMGEVNGTGQLPYSPDELVAIQKALVAGSLAAAGFTTAQSNPLRRHGLLTDSELVPDLHARVGQALYEALFPGDVATAFQMAWNQARTQRGAVSLQIRFDEDAVELARYPWEILYYRRHLLPSGGVELTRYISYQEAPTSLSVEPPLHVLYVESRPTGLAPLPKDTERETIVAALEPLIQDDLIVLDELQPPTYDALMDRLERQNYHILHFDGHGTSARFCPTCQSMNYPHYTNCQQAGCARALDDVPPLGYLAFERDNHKVDWVDSKAMESILYGSAVRIAILSACRSSEVRGDTLFGGVGPTLIQAGVPAVVAMQVPITASGTVKFMRGFYGSVARFESLSAAMTSARRRLFRTPEWFIPALYLRSQDEEGYLFNPR